MTIQTAFRDTNTTPFSMTSQLHHESARSNVSVLLGRDDVHGRFSMVGTDPLYIQMEAGMVLHVRAGSVEARQFSNRSERTLVEGERFAADHNGLLTVHSHTRAELQIDWATPVRERSSAVLRKN